MLKKYSKPSSEVLKLKWHFATDNNEFVQESLKQAEFYKAQPRRTCCKTCAAPLKGDALFVKCGIDYLLCERCHHLNGGYEDTEEFAKHIYMGAESDYGKHYRPLNMNDYLDRVRIIYEPKAEFMIECLQYAGEKPKDLSYCDVGSGSGYFVYALTKKCGIKKIIGYEVSLDQVNVATKMLGPGRVVLNEVGEVLKLVEKCEADVISMIGVLEHLCNPRQILDCVRKNRNVRYLYLLVPMFSLSVIFELLYPHFYSRQLTVDHTHLYTKDSIDWICREFGFKTIGEWHFGSDIMDFYRFAYLQLTDSHCNEPVNESFAKTFKPIIDDLQAVIDRHELCSDAHILLKKDSHCD